MPHLEPTYLRYIYDGLIKGSIHPENAAELPEGLIGLYEEAFDELQPVHKRQQLLERFAIWALLKKEVSAYFVAEVLNQPEEEIQEFISTYSAWFNSPESGKYQLYHERLKVYLLQKLSEGEVHALHEKIISKLEQAIANQKADEFEWYGLEFLTQHYAINAMLNGDGSKLLTLAYNQYHWQRQLKISKGYNWTKVGLHSVMSWASKHNDDEVIECGLQLVDLHNQEQNAAPQIVSLVAEGDFDSALKRIEQFGGNDKEGLQRKFILYMLCLMELTFLESKDKPFRKEGIEKILKHLDEQIPLDQTVLSWGDFFPNKLMFQLLCELEKINNDLNTILLRSNSFNYNFLKLNSKTSLIEKEVILKSCKVLVKPIYADIDQLLNLSFLLFNNNYFHEADLLLLKAKELSNKMKEGYYKTYRDISLKSIVFALNTQNKKQEAQNLLDDIESTEERLEAFLLIRIDSDNFLSLISKSLIELGDNNELKLKILKSIIKDSIIKKNNEISKHILDNYKEILAELDIFEQPEYQNFLVKCFCELNEIENAIEIADQIELRHEQEDAFSSIALWFHKNGLIENFNQYVEEVESSIIKAKLYSNIISLGTLTTPEIDDLYLKMISEIKNIPEFSTDDWGVSEYPRNEAIDEISNLLISKGFTELAINLGLLITNVENSINQFYFKILSDFEFVSDGKLSRMFHTYFLNSKIDIDVRKKDEYLYQIMKEYWTIEKYYQVITIFPLIHDDAKKLDEIINYFLNQALQPVKVPLISEMLKFCSDATFAEVLIKSNKEFEFGEILQVFTIFSDQKEKNSKLAFYVNRQLELGRSDLSIKLLDIIEDPYWKCVAMEYLIYYAGKTKNIELGLKLLEEINQLRKTSPVNIQIDYIKMKFYDYLSNEYYKSNDSSWKIFNKRSIEISRNIQDEREIIYNEFFLYLRKKHYKDLVQKIKDIDDEYRKERIIEEISSELLSEKHLSVINDIINLCPKNSNLLLDVILFFEQRKAHVPLHDFYDFFSNSWMDSLELAKQLFKINRYEQSLNVLYNIKKWGKAWAIIDFSIFLREEGCLIESKKLLGEAIELSIRENDSHAIEKSILELLEQNENQVAEEISQKISKLNEKQNCWMKMGYFRSSDKNKISSFNAMLNYKNEELKNYAIRGWVENEDLKNSKKDIICKVLYFMQNDLFSLANTLQNHAIQELFFENAPQEKIDRFNRTLNIQWAINLKNQMN